MVVPQDPSKEEKTTQTEPKEGRTARDITGYYPDYTQGIILHQITAKSVTWAEKETPQCRETSLTLSCLIGAK